LILITFGSAGILAAWERPITMMFRIAITSILLASLAGSLPAAPPAPLVFTGRIQDVRGTDGILTVTLGDGKRLTERSFLITEARVVGLGGAEWKVQDLRRGDRVEVEVVLRSGLVRKVRVLPDSKKK
jgi:hypothetical protein